MQDSTDAVVEITRSAMCAFDLHFRAMIDGTILGAATWTRRGCSSRPGAQLLGRQAVRSSRSRGH